MGWIRSDFDNVVSASISLKPELFLILRILESGYDLLNFISILYYYFFNGGARRDRTDDLLLAKQALSQLSYGPKIRNRTNANSTQRNCGIGRVIC